MKVDFVSLAAGITFCSTVLVVDTASEGKGGAGMLGSGGLFLGLGLEAGEASGLRSITAVHL